MQPDDPPPDPAPERLESRRIPSHGPVSPDGSRTWPRPSRGAKWLVWGGTALAAAALTAGTVIAARHALAALSNDRPDPPPPPEPRFAASDPESRRPPRPSLVQEIEANTAALSNGVENTMRAVSTAVSGFREVAGQANAILREFGDAATLAQDILGRNRPAPTRPDRDHDDPDTPADHDPRLHRL